MVELHLFPTLKTVFDLEAIQSYESRGMAVSGNRGKHPLVGRVSLSVEEGNAKQLPALAFVERTHPGLTKPHGGDKTICALLGGRSGLENDTAASSRNRAWTIPLLPLVPSASKEIFPRNKN